MNDCLVIIPTYNEQDNIIPMIEKVFSLPVDFDLLIIDDNSPDGTAELVREMQKKYPTKLHMIQRSGKLGLGTAYITGFKWALEKNYTMVCEMDCDFSHNPEDLPRLRKAILEGADVAVGSRYIEGGGVYNWPKRRILLSKGASLYARLITGIPVQDTTAGFVCYRREFLENLNMDKIVFKGYAFQIQMKYAAYLMGYIIKEIPIWFKDREEGVSKMSSNIIQEAILGVLKLRWNAIFNHYQK
ncbi:MAG: polyprenol monophosphomannose synthase [Chitinophagales bacterium]|nr:polyprenol monophosphomannose synthase [Sphingobacteriales bacterium]